METGKEIAVTEERTEKAIAEFTPNPAFVAAGALLPKSYREVMELSAIMAKSGVVPKEMVGRPEACAIAVMYGLELGLSPTQAMQNIMVVNNRPSLWGDAVKALVMGSGKCAEFDEDPPHVALKNGAGRCRLVRKKEFGGGEVEVVFSVDDAKRAKLWTKQGPWQDYPGRMLMFRARSWACRDLFGDVLKGMQMREELEDYEIIHAATPVSMPKRAIPPESVVDASDPRGSGDTPADTQNAQETKAGGETEASQERDPNARIDEAERKRLFKMWQEAGLTVENVKAHVKETFGVSGTPELTWAQAEQLETWIVKNAKR